MFLLSLHFKCITVDSQCYQREKKIMKNTEIKKKKKFYLNYFYEHSIGIYDNIIKII